MKIKIGTIALLILIILLVAGGCIFLPERAGYVKILVYSGDPNSPSAVVKSMEVLFVGIDGLTPFERYNIVILTSGNEKIAEYTLNATAEGKLPPTAMWPEAGLPLAMNDGPADPQADIQLGSYKIVLTGPNTDVTFPFTVISKNAPVIWSSDNTGKICNAFLESVDHVYVTGAHFDANQTVDVYIMRHKDIWTNGEILNDSAVYVTHTTAMTDAQKKLGPKDLGLAAFSNGCAIFDIIVDVNQNGILDDTDAVDSRNTAGYVVQHNPAPEYLKMQLASNGKATDWNAHWDATFYYPDTFNKDGSDTGFNWGYGNGGGIFCILNPLIDDQNPATHLVPYSTVQVWIITLDDFNNLAGAGYDLTGKDVSDAQGRPDLVTVQRTCGNGAGSILIWSAPLVDRRSGHPYVAGQGYVVIIEKPTVSGQFENKYHPATDYVDGVLNGGGPANQGFSVFGP
jgi:hypothetical protein